MALSDLRRHTAAALARQRLVGPVFPRVRCESAPHALENCHSFSISSLIFFNERSISFFSVSLFRLDGKAASIPRVVNVIRRLAALSDERGFAEKWNAPVGQTEAKKAEVKAKAESDLEQTRAKGSNKFSKDGPVSPRGGPSGDAPGAPSAVSAAAKEKDNEKLVAKLQADAKTDPDQNGPIHLAVKHKVLLPMLDTLNPSKEELNKGNKHKQTPLHVACQNADLESVEVLVKAGAAVNVSDDQDKTPLHYAAESVRPLLFSI